MLASLEDLALPFSGCDLSWKRRSSSSGLADEVRSLNGLISLNLEFSLINTRAGDSPSRPWTNSIIEERTFAFVCILVHLQITSESIITI